MENDPGTFSVALAESGVSAVVGFSHSRTTENPPENCATCTTKKSHCPGPLDIPAPIDGKAPAVSDTPPSMSLFTIRIGSPAPEGSSDTNADGFNGGDISHQ